MSNNLYVPVGAGLGDVLIYYLTGDVGYLKDWKRLYPSSKTRIQALSTSDQIKTLFEGFPNLDDVEVEYWQRVHQSKDGTVKANPCPGYRLITDADKRQLTYERPPFYLSEEEQALANETTGRGPYVIFHPFAGDYHRCFSGHFAWRETLTSLVEAGNHVVLLGGDSLRADQNRPIKEEHSFEHPRLSNLVNKGTVRLHAHLASKAKKAIVSSSAYNCVAHCCKVPTMTLMPDHLRPHVDQDQSGIFCWIREQGTQRVYWSEGPNCIVDRVLNWGNQQ